MKLKLHHNSLNPHGTAFVKIAVIGLLSLFLSGCLYSKVVTPLDTNMTRTELGDKVGRSSAQSVLYAVAWGDAGVAEAARNGDLKVIHHLDRETLIILFGLYVRMTTIAYGE